MKKLFIYILLGVLFWPTRCLFAEEVTTAEPQAVDGEQVRLSRDQIINEALDEFEPRNAEPKTSGQQKVAGKNFYTDEKLRRITRPKEGTRFFFIHQRQIAFRAGPRLNLKMRT